MTPGPVSPRNRARPGPANCFRFSVTIRPGRAMSLVTTGYCAAASSTPSNKFFRESAPSWSMALPLSDACRNLLALPRVSERLPLLDVRRSLANGDLEPLEFGEGALSAEPAEPTECTEPTEPVEPVDQVRWNGLLVDSCGLSRIRLRAACS